MIWDIRDLKGRLSEAPLREFKQARISIERQSHPLRGPYSWKVEITLKRAYLEGLATPHTIGVVLRDSAIEIEGQAAIYAYSVEVIEQPEPGGKWMHREAGEHMTIQARGASPLLARQLPTQTLTEQEAIMNIALLHAVRNLPIEIEAS